MAPRRDEPLRRPAVFGRLVSLLTVSALLSVAGCDSFVFTETYTLIEITSVTNGAPIVGAEVSAGIPSIENDYLWSRVAPTGADGQTHIPVRVVEGTQVVLHLTVDYGGRTSLLSVANIDNVAEEGDDLLIRVISAGANPPAPPLLQPVYGSNPPAITVDGYVRAINVCNNSLRKAEWQISSIDRVFLDTAIVGNTPSGYEDTTFETHISPPERQLCWALVYGVQLPASGFSICALGPFGNEWTCGGWYCLGAAGEAAVCSN